MKKRVIPPLDYRGWSRDRDRPECAREDENPGLRLCVKDGSWELAVDVWGVSVRARGSRDSRYVDNVLNKLQAAVETQEAKVRKCQSASATLNGIGKGKKAPDFDGWVKEGKGSWRRDGVFCRRRRSEKGVEWVVGIDGVTAKDPCVFKAVYRMIDILLDIEKGARQVIWDLKRAVDKILLMFGDWELVSGDGVLRCTHKDMQVVARSGIGGVSVELREKPYDPLVVTPSYTCETLAIAARKALYAFDARVAERRKALERLINTFVRTKMSIPTEGEQNNDRHSCLLTQ